MLNVGGAELLIILLVALIFLGPQRLPDVARQLGQTMSTLRSLATGFQAEMEAASRPDPDAAMSLAGPTDRDEAVKATQTDPAAIAAAARKVAYDDDSALSDGGPVDLRDEEE